MSCPVWEILVLMWLGATFMWLLVVMWFSYRLGRILRDFKKWCP